MPEVASNINNDWSVDQGSGMVTETEIATSAVMEHMEHLYKYNYFFNLTTTWAELRTHAGLSKSVRKQELAS